MHDTSSAWHYIHIYGLAAEADQAGVLDELPVLVYITLQAVHTHLEHTARIKLITSLLTVDDEITSASRG